MSPSDNLQDIFGDPKPASNPAEQNPSLNSPETSEAQKVVDEASLGMKPSRSDSSSETFVADKTEALRHDQAQRIQEGNTQSGDAPLDVKNDGGEGSGDSTTAVTSDTDADPNLRSTVNPGGLTDVSPEGIADSTKTSVVRLLGQEETEENKDAPFEAYVAGRKVLITTEQKERYDQLLKETSDALKGRGTDNVALNDPYWAKKGELEAFAAGL